AAMAALLYWQSSHQQKAAVVLTAKSIFFLILTVPILFSKHWITIFWTIQAAALFLTGLKIKSSKLTVAGNILFLITIIKFVFLDYILIFHLDKYFTFFPAVISPYKYLLIERYITSGVLLASLLCAAHRDKRMKTLGLLPENLVQLHSHTCLFAAFGLLLFIILNVEVSSAFYNYLPNARFAAVSVLWALFSIGLMATGFRSNEKTLRKISISLFFITIIKLFFFDMSRFNTPYRIISFIVLGLVLIGTSFLYYKFKDRIIDVIAVDEDKVKQN
ncbi:MAG: DUF2339 domain-containing protein, partial [Candidatus Auribacterota bacterium]|nr:DUF2339 domain-containing protein [Candidatus Auribacterota bacterium]